MHSLKKIVCLFCLCIACFRTAAQPLPDSVKIILNEAKTSVDKGKILIRYFNANVDDDTLFKNLISLKQFFEEKKDPVIVDYVRLGICRQLARGAEYGAAINELFQLLSRFEQRKDEYGIMTCYMHFSYAYYAAGDKEKTLYYDQRAIDLSIPLGIKYELATAYNNLAADRAEYGIFDSVYLYATNAVKISKEINEPQLISKTLGTLGEYYMVYQEIRFCTYLFERGFADFDA